MSIVYELLDGDRARALAGPLRDLYAEVYAEPPYEEGPEHVWRFTEHFATEVDRAGFSLAAAMDGADLVGAAYGWTMAPGVWWSRAKTDPPAGVRDTSKLAIMEWMVRALYRRRGVGRQLMNLLLAGRTEPYATLAANPQAPARTIYGRLGWQQCGISAGDALLPGMDLLVLPLGGHPAG